MEKVGDADSLTSRTALQFVMCGNCGYVVADCLMVWLILSGQCWMECQYLSLIYFRSLAFGL